MSPYLVMLRKDLRRLAVPLGVWLVLLGASTYFNLMPAPTDPDSRGLTALWEIWKGIGFLLYWLATIFIAAAVVLEDPPHGTEAFWRTRPFPGSSVLAAKLTVIGILIGLPLVVSAVGLILANVSLPDVALATLSALLERGMIPLAAAAVAATAESFGKFALTAIFLLIGGVMVAMVTAVWVFFGVQTVTRGALHPLNLNQTPTLLASKVIAAQLFVLGASAGLFIWRYRQRHIRFFLGYVALIALIWPLFSSLWRWDFLPDRTAEQRIAIPMVHGVHFSVKVEPLLSARTFSNVAVFSGANPRPNQEIVPLSFSNAWFLFPNGDRAEVNNSSGFVPPLSSGTGSPELLRNAVAPAVILNPPERNSARFVLNVPSPMGRDRLYRESSVFRANLEAAVVQCEVAGELPLQAGSSGMMDGRNTALLGSTENPVGQIAVTLRQGWLSGALATAFHREVEANRTMGFTGLPIGGNAWAAPVYLLVNRTRQQALIGKQRNGAVGPASGLGNYSIQTLALDFEGEVLDREWAQQAVLVCLRYRRVGTAASIVESAPLNLSP